MTRTVAIGLLAFALTAGAAHGAPAGGGWSVSASDVALDGGATTLARDGRALAVGSTCDTAGCTGTLATHAPGEAFLPGAELPGSSAAFTALRGGAALLVTTLPRRRGLSASDVAITGRIVRSTGLTRRVVREAIAASNRDGATAVAWLTNRLPQRLRVRTRRNDGAAFAPARTLASFAREGRFGGAAVAVGPRGEIAVVWASGGSLHARVQNAGAHRFGPVLRIRRSDRAAMIATAFTARGSLVAIWSSADGGEEQNRTAIVRVAMRRSGTAQFAPSHTLGAGAAREPLALAHGAAVRAVAAGSTAMVAWTTASLRTRIASVTGAGAVTGARTIDPDGVLGDAEGSASRHVLVAWTHAPLSADAGARAAIATPGGRFAGEPIGPRGSWATGAALDRAGNRALVTWGAGDAVLSPRWGFAERSLP